VPPQSPRGSSCAAAAVGAGTEPLSWLQALRTRSWDPLGAGGRGHAGFTPSHAALIGAERACALLVNMGTFSVSIFPF